MGHRPPTVDTAPERRAGAIATALATPRRQALLERLVEIDQAVVPVRTLADALDGDDAEPERATAGPDRRRLDIALHHVDLPKLEEAGILTYDPAAGTVSVRRPRLAEAALSVARAP